MKRVRLSVAAVGLALLSPLSLFAQDASEPAAPQDPSLNNLVHPPGYEPVPVGTLGRVEIIGHGPRHVVMFPGWGMDASVFRPLAELNRDRFTMILVTPAGYGETPAPPLDPAGVDYAAGRWNEALREATWDLLDRLDVESALLVGHMDGAQTAWRMAMEKGERVRGVLAVCGDLYRPVGPGQSPEDRERGVESMAQRWFKTVTPATWRDGMGGPGWHAVDPDLSEALFEKTLEASIPTMVRYLLEKWSYDPLPTLDELDTPVVALLPDLEHPDDSTYKRFVEGTLEAAWRSVESSPHVTLQRVEGGRISMMADHAGAVSEALRALDDRVGAGRDG